MGFITNAGYAGVCGFGAWMLMNGDIEIGVIVAFLVYLRLFMQPIGEISQTLMAIKSLDAA